jgi:hypothetical protein
MSGDAAALAFQAKEALGIAPLRRAVLMRNPLSRVAEFHASSLMVESNLIYPEPEPLYLALVG